MDYVSDEWRMARKVAVRCELRGMVGEWSVSVLACVCMYPCLLVNKEERGSLPADAQKREDMLSISLVPSN